MLLKAIIPSILLAFSLCIFAFPLQAGIGHDHGGASARGGSVHGGSVGGFNDNSMGRDMRREACMRGNQKRNSVHCPESSAFYGELRSDLLRAEHRIRGEQRLRDRK